MIDVLDTGQSLGTHGPSRVGIRITLDIGYGTVFKGYENATTAVTTFTGTPYDMIFAHNTIPFSNSYSQ
jgi:hypothetical protein